MGLLSKVVSYLVLIGFIALFYVSIKNFYVAIIFILICTISIILTVNSDEKNKIVNLVYSYLQKFFLIFFKEIKIEKELVKLTLIIALLFYGFIIFTLLGNMKSFQDCLSKNGVEKISYCYTTYERRQIIRNY